MMSLSRTTEDIISTSCLLNPPFRCSASRSLASNSIRIKGCRERCARRRSRASIAQKASAPKISVRMLGAWPRYDAESTMAFATESRLSAVLTFPLPSGIPITVSLGDSIRHQTTGTNGAKNFAVSHIQRSYGGAVNLQGNRPAKQRNGQHNPVVAFEIDENPFETPQGIRFDANLLPDLQIRPWLGVVSRSDHRLNGGNLRIFHRHRYPAPTDHGNYARGDENWKAIPNIKPTKYIPWKKGSLRLLRPATPALLDRVGRQQRFVTLARKQHGSGAFPPRSYLQCIPAAKITYHGHRGLQLTFCYC